MRFGLTQLARFFTLLAIRKTPLRIKNRVQHSILNVVYHTHEDIELGYGSILDLTTEEIGAELIQKGLAPQTARRWYRAG